MAAGEVTAELHEALAAAAPGGVVSRADTDRWRAEAEHALDEAVAVEPDLAHGRPPPGRRSPLSTARSASRSSVCTGTSTWPSSCACRARARS